MKHKKIISMLLLACFFFTSVVVQPQKQAEAIVPIVAVLVDAAVCAAISAGVTYAIPKIEEHVAATQVEKMSDMERRALEIEGGLSEMTVADAKRLGVKTKPGAKKVYKVKGAGKAALISGILTLGIAGVSYGIDYYSKTKVSDIPDCVSENVVTGGDLIDSLAPGQSYTYEWERVQDDHFVHVSHTQGLQIHCMLQGYYFQEWRRSITIGPDGYTTSKIDGEYVYVTDVSMYMDDGPEADKFRDRVLFIKLYPSGDVLSTRAYGCHNPDFYVTVTNQSDVSQEFTYGGTGVNDQYRYTGTVPAEDIAVTDSPYIDAQRERLEQAKDDDEKIIYLIQNTDGSVDVETSTELEDGTEIVDLSPTTGTTTPADPTENGKPDLNDLYGVVTTRWPFSLPWDVAYLLNIVFADPVPPKWTFTLPEDFGSHEFTVDMTQLEGFMPVVRWFITFAFCFGIVFAIRKLYGGSV